MIDLDAVASLRAVQQQGSVGAAAGALGFTPSAGSRSRSNGSNGSSAWLGRASGAAWA